MIQLTQAIIDKINEDMARSPYGKITLSWAEKGSFIEIVTEEKLRIEKGEITYRDQL